MFDLYEAGFQFCWIGEHIDFCLKHFKTPPPIENFHQFKGKCDFLLFIWCDHSLGQTLLVSTGFFNTDLLVNGQTPKQ